MTLAGLVIRNPGVAPEPARIRVDEGRVAQIEPTRASGGPLPVISTGFIDSHLHPLELGLQELFVDLVDAASVRDVLARLSAWTAANAGADTVFGFNLRPDLLSENRYPTASELDTVTTAPLLVYRIDGHSAALNTTGLRTALKSLDVPGVDRDEGGTPSGVLRGQAYELASRTFKRRLGPDTVRRALGAAAAKAAAAGTTTIAALVGTDDLGPDDFRLLVDGLAALAVRAVPFLQTTRTDIARNLSLGRVGGCILIDGSFGSHTAALDESYVDSPDNRGICYFTDEQLTTFFRDASELGLQTAVHAIGDRAVGQVVGVHERLGTCTGGNPLRHRIEHAELLSPELVDRIAGLGLVIGTQPAFEAWWGGPDGMYAARVGRRWRDTNPYRSLLDAGVTLAGGSDAPITPIDPLAGIRAAVGHPNPAQRISGSEAYAMFTTAAAYSLGLELRTGTLEPGTDADFAVLSSDPRADAECRVLATYRRGECIHESGPSKTAPWQT